MTNKALKAIDRAIAELQDQLEGLEEARAQISGMRRPSRPIKKAKEKRAATKSSTGKGRGGRGKFSEEQKKAASERMKKSWADRRARGEVPPKKVKVPKKKKAAKKIVKKKTILRGRAKKNIGGSGELSSAKMYEAWKKYNAGKQSE